MRGFRCASELAQQNTLTDASGPVDEEQRDGALRYVRVQCRTKCLDFGRAPDEILVAQLAQTMDQPRKLNRCRRGHGPPQVANTV